MATYREKIMGDAKRLIKQTPELSGEDKRKILQIAEDLVDNGRGTLSAEKAARAKIDKILKKVFLNR